MPSLPPERLTPSATRALLECLGHRPVRKWGQNFLIDPNLVAKSLELANVQSGDHIVEIGPGLGCLTAALLNAGTSVYAVEIDKRLAAHLRERFGARAAFHLHEGDAVETPTAAKPPEAIPWKVIANLPYAISTPWLEQLLRCADLPESLTLMLQREAAQRFTAPPGTKAFSAITIFLQSTYEATGEHRVARQCFYPVPGVDSQLLQLRRKPNPVRFAESTRELIRTLFTQRRKQIGPLARQLLGETAAEAWFTHLAAHGHSPQSRAEALPLSCWARLGQSIEGGSPPPYSSC